MSNFKNFKHCTARYMLIALLLALFMSLTLMSCGSSGDSSDKHVHTYSSAWSRDAKDHWHAATCGHDVVSDKAAHTYGDWTVVTAATATRDGLRRKTCSVCRYAQEEVIPKTGSVASDAEALNGVFSVSSSGKEVSFSKGNLYYTGSVWKFENNQYDFRTWSGKDAVVNGVYSSTGTPSGNIGLFYWSKNKNIAIAETYNDPGRSADDTFFVNTDSFVAGADWIALSSSEWDYLLNTRSNALSKRGLASINTGSTSVKGLVLLPDSWTLPNGCNFTGTEGSYSTNSYTKAQWTAMEAAGAVFFPASGIRNGGSAKFVQSDGYYGSSTPAADKDYANEMGFYIGLIGTDSYDRIYGGSIRPVMSKSHTHTYSSEWTSDADYHWHSSTCGHDVVSDKAAHTYGNWTTVTDATTSSTGLICTSCTVCGYILEEVIPVVIPDHTHTYASAWSSDTNYHWHASTCGHDVTKDKAAHSWNSGEVTTSATHTANGVKTYTCTVCGKTKTETIPAQTDEDIYETAWTSDADYHWHASTWWGNDVRYGMGAHGWNSGTVITPATHTASGVKTYTCTVCGKTKTETIPAQRDDLAATLSGVFTVSSNGKKVKFSCGNLYYTGSSWGFEDNQYDFSTWHGHAEVKNGAYLSNGTASGNTGLFFWSSGTNIAVASSYREPNRTNMDLFFLDVNPVMGSAWFTLSRNEWYYLINTRTNASSKKGWATIYTGSYNIKGLVLLPDSWTLPSGCSFTSGYGNGYETNTYTASQWAAMESAGAVFLPAAGRRMSNVEYEQSYGRYLSSTLIDRDYAIGISFGISFKSHRIEMEENYRGIGGSVRLVTLVDPAETVSVTFNANGGSGTMVSQTVYKSVDTTLNYNTFIRSNYVFTGWNTSPNGTGTSYADGGTVNLTESMTLYAQWKAISNLYPLPYPLSNVLSGEFTVSSGEKKVKFSRGNLYYTGSSWGFEDYQCDFRTWQGSPSVKNGVYSETGTTSGNRGLFYWSKNTNKAVAASYNRTIVTSFSDVFFLDLNPVMGSDWFTLSYNEWDYLINIRTNASSKKGLATINTGSYNIKGLVLLPDSWTLPSGCTFTSGYGNGYSTNIYTASQWAAMEFSGAVFLPAAGLRYSLSDVNYVKGCGDAGYYWSSTPDYSYEDCAGGMAFFEDYINVYVEERCYAVSVRLVTLSKN